MSIWNDLFEIYQSVQSDERDLEGGHDELQTKAGSITAPISDDNQITPTVYVFAYIDDGKGNITRNIAVEDRITMLELKNQELEHRYNILLEQLDESDDSDD